MRFGATWGVPREGNVYKYYEADVDLQPPIIEYKPVGQKEQTIINCKRWAAKSYPKLNQDDIGQEIDFKAWQLEFLELNERNEWARPAYVMTALKNTVHDYARQEIGYGKANKLKEDVLLTTRFDVPPVDHEIPFTAKTLKAGLLLFLVSPSHLSLITKDRLYCVYRMMSNAEHKALLQTALHPTNSSIRSLDRLVLKYLDCVNG